METEAIETVLKVEHFELRFWCGPFERRLSKTMTKKSSYADIQFISVFGRFLIWTI